ncbi:hypothetical protein [Parasitella parasitica]|uniref:Sorting nexin-4 n=1 Tax=Parasitella parasitica TaxID=35722 RepID=A0A0B7N6P7_9FUNG|nr:hypothetical protein [Parasitella parasitica]
MSIFDNNAAGPSWYADDNENDPFNTSRSAYFEQSQNFGASSSSSDDATAAAAIAAFDPFQSEYDQETATFDGKMPAHSYQKPAPSEDNVAEPMTIRVDDPLKSNNGSYITFRVFTMTALKMYNVDNRPVRRRFRDFLWLHNALSVEHPACVIPPLPEKHRIKYMRGDRFDPMFVEQRRLGFVAAMCVLVYVILHVPCSLQWFMDRIARHPLLQISKYTKIFLESTDFKADKSIQSKSPPSSNSIFGSFFKSLAKVKKPDEKFEEMKESIDKFQDNLNIVEKLYSRIGKRQQELEHNYNHFAGSIRGLSGLETNVDQPLRQFAEATELYVEALKEMRKQEDLCFLNDVHELLNYCNAAKDQLTERDQQQVYFEDSSTALQSVVLERERILYPGKNMGSTAAGMSIAELMTDKMSDSNKTRNERVLRLEAKIKELQDLVAKANDINNSYSNQMIKEFEIFQRAREAELKQGLSAYADCHIDFYKKVRHADLFIIIIYAAKSHQSTQSISIWQNILPVLDNIQLEE